MTTMRNFRPIPYVVYSVVLALILLLMSQSTIAQSKKDIKLNSRAQNNLKNYADYFAQWQHVGNIKLDSIATNSANKQLNLYFSPIITYIPIREAYIDSIVTLIKNDLGRKFKHYQINLFTKNKPLSYFIPNAYRKITDVDNQRIAQPIVNKTPLIKNTHKPSYSQGLQNNHIALWHSHGWYYEAKLDRWEWQRARLYGSVEDIGTMAYVLPYLVPMLENAGAVTLLPRERDTQHNEVVVDRDKSTGESQLFVKNGTHAWGIKQDNGGGFALKDTLYEGQNPFKQGSYLTIKTNGDSVASLTYIPDIPETGEYAVYVSWVNTPDNVPDASYKVYHTGGVTQFTVNQTISGSTWVYLGKFIFLKGKNYIKGRVELDNTSTKNGVITADAVRFGGGVGTVARRPGSEYVPLQWSLAGGNNASLKNDDTNLQRIEYTWKLSERARYLEGARYYLQYAGIPFSVYSLTEGKNDYNDDYQSRGEWVNYLLGQHVAANTDSTVKTGLHIPIDMAFAFHTDAGVTPNDSIIGTLGIYSTEKDNPVFANGQSKAASRDLTDLIQTQLVNDIRTQFNPKWTRRAMWDKAYSEAWRPQVPTMLLELLSHQNYADMRFGLDPRYRFAVSRAIYKGMLRYQATQEGHDYVVQPLAPSHFAITVIGDKQVKLTWKATTDTLEPTAQPTQYRVYQRIANGGFDNGTLTNNEFFITDLPQSGTIYSYRVAAVNNGGESFPSQTLAVCLQDNDKKPVLIVNAFDRICAPKMFDLDTIAGVAWWDDMGVPYIADISFIGNQYDFKRKSNWVDDDNPGWGASYADMEGKIVPGNTFDFVYTHGKAIAQAGYSFTSVSNEVFQQQATKPNDYCALDIILGEQRSTPDFINPAQMSFTVYTPNMTKAIDQFIDARKGIFISGAYVGTDMEDLKDSVAITFVKTKLHYTWRTNHADNSGKIKLTDAGRSIITAMPKSATFNAAYHPQIYTVEAPDAIEPSGNGAITLYRYSGNNTSAGVLYNGSHKSITLGFPFETIIDEGERNDVMKSILKFLE